MPFPFCVVGGAQALHGNPYDGHTLKAALEQVRRIAGRDPEQAFVDMGYRGQGLLNYKFVERAELWLGPFVPPISHLLNS